MASNGIDCYVKLPTGQTVSFLLQNEDTVDIVYSKVSEELNVATDRVLIKYTGKVLNRSHTVGYLGVCKETILKAEVSNRRRIIKKVVFAYYVIIRRDVLLNRYD